jgi:lipoprotein-releasing system ATP-binding protein
MSEVPATDRPTEILRAEGVSKTYRMGDSIVEVLRDLDLSVAEGEIVAVVGASGVGKSTLLHILGVLDRPDSGRLWFRGRDVTGLNGSERARLRNRAFGFVFQFYHLIPELTALENVLLPGMIAHRRRAWRRQKAEAHARATDVLDRMGLGHRLRHRPPQLSGGERQRVAIARAIYNRPAVLLCDEPTGNLDPKTSAGIRDLLHEVNREEGQTMVVVTHDEELALDASRVLRMRDGRFESGSTEDASGDGPSKEQPPEEES